MTPDDEPLIDPADFPFTEAELRRALSQVMSAERAGDEARRNAAGMREAAAGRRTFDEIVSGKRPWPTEATAEHPGAPRGVGAPSYVWYRSEALALLWLVDDALAQRVEAYRAAERARERPRRLQQAMWRATGEADVQPAADVLDRLAAEDAAEDAAWAALVRRMQRRMSERRSARQ